MDEQELSRERIEGELKTQYGLLLSQSQLAALLGRTTGGLRYSLCYPSDHRTRALKDCGRRIGRRIYYPAGDVAAIIATDTDA